MGFNIFLFYRFYFSCSLIFVKKYERNSFTKLVVTLFLIE